MNTTILFLLYYTAKHRNRNSTAIFLIEVCGLMIRRNHKTVHVLFSTHY